jgi:hypothetical protein
MIMKKRIAHLTVILMGFNVLLLAQSSEVEKRGNDKGFVSLFNGINLNGWQGDSTYWRVEDKCLVGEVTPTTLLNRNSFIIWQGKMPDDFELKVNYRISARGNSGINYRSAVVTDVPFALKGYQADIDGEDNWSGQNYEERGREFLALRGQKVSIEDNDHVILMDTLGTKQDLQEYIRKEEWNEYHLIIKGNRMRHYINGMLMSDVTDNDLANRSFSGLLGVQVHVGPPMKIEYRDFKVKKLI